MYISGTLLAIDEPFEESYTFLPILSVSECLALIHFFAVKNRTTALISHSDNLLSGTSDFSLLDIYGQINGASVWFVDMS